MQQCHPSRIFDKHNTFVVDIHVKSNNTISAGVGFND